MNIIVTGASGHFGRESVARLLERLPASQVIAVSRNPGSLADLAARGVAVRFGDFDQPESLKAAFAGGERMLLISTSAVGRRREQHKHAIDAARAAGVKHIVYTSFVGARPGDPSLVGKEHRATEELLRESGLAWTFMRDSQYGEALAEMAIPNHLRDGKWRGISGEGQIALVSRADCVASAVAALCGQGHENRIYHITGPELLTFPQVAALAAEVSGRPLRYVAVSDAEMYAYYDSLGVPRATSENPNAEVIPWSSDDMVSFEQAIRGGYFSDLSGDVLKLTGKPPISMRDILMAHRHLYITHADPPPIRH